MQESAAYPVSVSYQWLHNEYSPNSKVNNLLSDFGGQIGLFLGMSVISAIEILVLIIQASFYI